MKVLNSVMLIQSAVSKKSLGVSVCDIHDSLDILPSLSAGS